MVPLNNAGVRAGGLRNPGDIPSVDIFTDPIYQWYAGSVDADDGQTADPLPDEVSGQDATAVNSPVFRANQAGKPAVENDGTDDSYTFNPVPGHPSGSDPVTVAMTLYTTGNGYVIWWGNRADKELFTINCANGGEYNIAHYGAGNAVVSANYNEWITIVGTYDGSDLSEIYYNGTTNTASNSVGTLSVADTNHSIAFDVDSGGNQWPGYIYEIVVSGAKESDSVIEDYYNKRIA